MPIKLNPFPSSIINLVILCTRRSSNSASFNGFAASMNPILYVLRNTTFAYSASCPESVTVKAKLRQPVAVIHYNPLHRRSWLLLNLLNSLLGFIDFCKSKAALSYHQSFSNNNHSTPQHLINFHFIPTGTAIRNKYILRWRKQSLQMCRKISVCLSRCLFAGKLGHL